MCLSHPQATHVCSFTSCLHHLSLCLTNIYPFPRYLISVAQCSQCCHCNVTPLLKSSWYHSFSHNPALVCPISLLAHMLSPPPPSPTFCSCSPIISKQNTRLAYYVTGKVQPLHNITIQFRRDSLYPWMLSCICHAILLAHTPSWH